MTIPRIANYAMPRPSELPNNKVTWPADPSRAALLVHDMQCYFADFYASGNEPRTLLDQHISTLHAACQARGVPTVFTAQPPHAEPKSRGLLNDMWGPGLPARPDQGELVPFLKPGPHDRLLYKTRYSAFFGSDLADQLRAWGRDQLWICGVYAHIGCLVTAQEAFMRDIKPFLIADAIAGFNRADHEQAVHLTAQTCGRIIHSQALLDTLALQHDSSAIWNMLQAELARLLDVDASSIAIDADLRSLGMDSVRMLELLDQLELHGHPLEVTEFLACETVGQVLNAIKK